MDKILTGVAINGIKSYAGSLHSVAVRFDSLEKLEYVYDKLFEKGFELPLTKKKVSDNCVEVAEILLELASQDFFHIYNFSLFPSTFNSDVFTKTLEKTGFTEAFANNNVARVFSLTAQIELINGMAKEISKEQPKIPMDIFIGSREEKNFFTFPVGHKKIYKAHYIENGDYANYFVNIAKILARYNNYIEMVKIEEQVTGYNLTTNLGTLTKGHVQEIERYDIIEGVHRKGFGILAFTMFDVPIKVAKKEDFYVDKLEIKLASLRGIYLIKPDIFSKFDIELLGGIKTNLNNNTGLTKEQGFFFNKLFNNIMHKLDE